MKVLWKANTHWCPFALVIIIQYALWPSNLSQFVNSYRLLSPLLFFSSSFLVALHQLRKRCSPPLSLFGQLLWREFFYTAATNNPNFDHMEGNPICVQVGLCITQKKRFPLNSKETCEHKIQTIDRHTALNAPRNFIYAAFWSRRHLCQAFVKLPSQSRTSTMWTQTHSSFRWLWPAWLRDYSQAGQSEQILILPHGIQSMPLRKEQEKQD